MSAELNTGMHLTNYKKIATYSNMWQTPTEERRWKISNLG